MLLRSLALSAALVITPALPAQPSAGSATPAATAAASSTAPFTKPELAYWLQLQKDLTELRAANLTARIRNTPFDAPPDVLSAIASRFEKFLDQRDKDPVADLGPELKDYRERLMKLVDLALTPVTGAAKFKSTLVTNGEERMMTVFKIFKEVEAVDEYKPKLAQLHDALNRRAIAAGAEARFFFQSLGVGDKARAADSLGSPEERDAQFIKDATAIGPVFGDIAKGQFIAARKAQGANKGLMDPVIQTLEKFRKQFADAPTDQLQQGLNTAESMQEKPGEFKLKRHVLRLELQRRKDPNAYSIAMQEFQGAFRRWLGEADEIAPLGMCRDLAAAPDGSWFAYASAEKTVIIRDAASGKTRATIETDGPVRALTAAAGNKLMIFTTGGLFAADATSPAPKPELRSPLKSVFLEPRIGAARTADRFVFALGVKPGFMQEGEEHTFSVQKLASRVTAVAMSGNGMSMAYGYAGDNLTGAGDPLWGFDVLTYAGERIELKGDSTQSRRSGPPITAAALSLAMSTDGKRVAAGWFGRHGGAVTLDDFSEKDTKRAILTLDGDAYQWVQIIEGPALRVVAGTRSGNVRIWDPATRELVASFSVPAGPSGTVYGLLGGDIVSVALGQPAVHRWKLDGTLVGSFEGDAPKVDPAALSARLTSERAWVPVREMLIAALDAKEGAESAKQIETLRTTQAKLLDAMGQRQMVDSWFARIRADQIAELGKAKRAVEGFELGYKEITTGVVDNYLLYLTLYIGNRVGWSAANMDVRKRLMGIGEKAVALYPSDIPINREYRKARSDHFAETGKIAEALKEVDQLDIIDPAEAPHADRRYDILMFAYDFAHKAGRERDALNHLVTAIDYTTDKKEQQMLTTNIFSIAYKLKDFKLAVNAANMAMKVDPALKNDTNFMNAARYAYQMANPQPAQKQQTKR